MSDRDTVHVSLSTLASTKKSYLYELQNSSPESDYNEASA